MAGFHLGGSFMGMPPGDTMNCFTGHVIAAANEINSIYASSAATGRRVWCEKALLLYIINEKDLQDKCTHLWPQKDKKRGQKKATPLNYFYLSRNMSSKLNTFSLWHFALLSLLLINYGCDAPQEMLIDRLLVLLACNIDEVLSFSILRESCGGDSSC